MGLFDKIKDNAKAISIKAIESTREYDEDYVAARGRPEDTAAVVTQQAEKANEPTDPGTDDSAFYMDEESAAEAAEAPAEETEADESPEPAPAIEPDDASRHSKITEVSKSEYEETQHEKKRAETKQAAKERLAKSYTPSYKSEKKTSKIEVADKDIEAEAVPKQTAEKKPARQGKNIGIVDITPKRLPDPLKGAIYARERAALSAIASQRKLNGTVPLYVAQHMNFKTRVFINRIEYSGSFGKNTLPIDKVAWVKLRHGGTGVIIETTEGKRVVMVVRPTDRLAFADAVIKVQAMQPKKGKFKDTQTVRIDELERFSEGVDELETLAKLYDKGIINKDEFDAKKKQILGI